MGGLDLSPPDAACVVARHHRPKAAHHPHVRPKAAVPGTAAAAPCDAAPGRRWDQRHQGPPWGGTAEARGAGQQQAQQRVAYDDDGSDVDGDVDDDVGPAPAGKDAIICNLFDQRCTLLGATLESVEAKCQLLASRLALAEEERAEGLDRRVRGGLLLGLGEGGEGWPAGRPAGCWGPSGAWLGARLRGCAARR